MHARCPGCGYVYEREPGYFLGAIIIGYLLAVAIVVASTIIVRTIAPRVSWELAVSLGFAAYLLLSVVVFRYARSAWMYLDYILDPPDRR